MKGKRPLVKKADISWGGPVTPHVSSQRSYGNHLFKRPEEFKGIQNQDLNMKISSLCIV
jgi:hypothetical protein